MNPLVPRLIDRPTVVDLDAPDWAAMDTAKIIAAPEDPADWPRWRAVLDQWRAGVADRHPIGAAAYEQPEGRWAQTCFAIAQIWLWDELLYDFDPRRASPPSGCSRTRIAGSAGSTASCCGTPIP